MSFDRLCCELYARKKGLKYIRDVQSKKREN